MIERPIGAELVVYDPVAHKAHCLNPTAALVFRAANGQRSLAAVADSVAEAARAPVSEDVVWSALQRLAAAQLLHEPLAARPQPRTRRSVLCQVGLTAAALAPAVASLVVPTPAEAAGTCIPAAACTTLNAGQSCYNLSAPECANHLCTGVAGVCSP